MKFQRLSFTIVKGNTKMREVLDRGMLPKLIKERENPSLGNKYQVVLPVQFAPGRLRNDVVQLLAVYF